MLQLTEVGPCRCVLNVYTPMAICRDELRSQLLYLHNGSLLQFFPLAGVSL